jgi:hypothetical protein
MLIAFLLAGGWWAWPVVYRVVLFITTLMLPIVIGYGGRRCNPRHRPSSFFGIHHIEKKFNISTLPDDAITESSQRSSVRVRLNLNVDKGIFGFIPRRI